ncbi:hypothetical protein BD410DRAFT_622818 [Rickenella mellea]|uniref:Uncharacterized protein n=1 Tax=Rickenella mellea TaxID=50990 RepID=A0A4Y7PN82_9AGAM|nr:hypothetical protein BD410DRAFT_622818 [Rickenella mellea]
MVLSVCIMMRGTSFQLRGTRYSFTVVYVEKLELRIHGPVRLVITLCTSVIRYPSGGLVTRLRSSYSSTLSRFFKCMGVGVLIFGPVIWMPRCGHS